MSRARAAPVRNTNNVAVSWIDSMAVGLGKLPVMHPVSGVRLGTACAEIKQNQRDDLTVIALDAGSSIAGVFTRNAFCAAPVTLAKEHLAQGQARYLLINSGNANAGTGESGMAAAKQTCSDLAGVMQADASQVLPFSTGVIGQLLPADKIAATLPRACEALSADGWSDAAQAIMTTDTLPKGASQQLDIAGKAVTITGICKGAGMIRPDMATMLAYVAIDAAVPADLLQSIISYAADRSFNRVTIDGDTSTNDACMLMATGQGALQVEVADSEEYLALRDAVTAVCQTLAQAIVRDGEGATKFVTIEVEQARDDEEAAQVAYTVAHSPLVKTALFASDPNWGRILAAVGRSGVENFDLSRVDIDLGDVRLIEAGQPHGAYTEEKGQKVMDADDITIRIGLGRGEAATVLWTCDFSYDYVRINAEYRT